MSTMIGCVFNIARFSIDDGPGIRTTVFLKGCPLRCEWCHNPESISPFKELLYISEKCIVCGNCVNACENNCHMVKNGSHNIDVEKCSTCGNCTEVCPVGALKICGNYLTAESVIEEVKKDKSFYDSSNGGMTISGGEPLLSADFTKELLKLAHRENIHTCVETSGMCDPSVLAEIAKETDLFLFDYKHSDSEKLKKYTGASYDRIYENLKLLESLNNPVILRCPIIPGVSDTQLHLDNVVNTAMMFSNIIAVNVLPYHSFGEQKYLKLISQKRTNTFTVPSDEEITNWISYLKQHIKKPIK